MTINVPIDTCLKLRQIVTELCLISQLILSRECTAKISDHLSEVYRLIQCSPNLILTDKCEQTIGSSCITPCHVVRGYGFKLSCCGVTTIVQHRTILIEDRTPINVLLDHCVVTEDSHYDAICELKAFYEGLLLKYCCTSSGH